jgi:hypothetical protein
VLAERASLTVVIVSVWVFPSRSVLTSSANATAHQTLDLGDAIANANRGFDQTRNPAARTPQHRQRCTDHINHSLDHGNGGDIASSRSGLSHHVLFIVDEAAEGRSVLPSESDGGHGHREH